jgi:hypothetical protein
VTYESEGIERFEGPGFVGRRYGRFRVRDIRGRNVVVNELRDV